MKVVFKFFQLIQTAGQWAAPVILLLTRLLVGVPFFYTGMGKLKNLDSTTLYFIDLGIPMPKFNAIMAGSTEMVGGALLAIGLASRLVSIPLAVTMLVALFTAHRPETLALFNDFSKFLELKPIPYLFVTLFVFAFGPGYISVDTFIKHAVRKHAPSTPDGQTVKTANDAG